MNTEELQKIKEGLEISLKSVNELLFDLEKPKEPACLSFLQLAEKHDKSFASKIRNIVLNTNPLFWENKLLDENSPDYLKVSSYIESDLRISQQQARKFVAEIYLTLLAKELNAGNEKDCHYVVCMQPNKNLVVYYNPFSKTSDPVRFETHTLGEISLTYSAEAITMWNWNWYFGREEGK